MKKKNCYLLLLLFCYVIPTLQAQSDKKVNLNIVYIGNSITQGAIIKEPQRNAPPVKACEWLQNQSGIGKVEFSNQGRSGNTTVDFLPAAATYFPKVKAAADLFKGDKDAILLFSIMLGTNDSAEKGPNGSPVSPVQYYTNVKVIVDELLRMYPEAKVVLHYPLWYSPNTYNSATYLKAGLKRLESYMPQIDALVEAYKETVPGNVFKGDTEGFEYFRINYEKEFFPENGNAGTFYLHPNETGTAHLGEFWGKAIYRVITSDN
ncbi:GDSL-type esterase/lipase family protein [Parabacteroides sp. OttesenSCG-928-K15]|nr:GDSL-type esterase/lipase family protein [Parabacteroides sp. OttesenSCG-928-K15]